jgi:hypothetical protein
LASFTMLCSTAAPEPLQESPAHVNRRRPFLGSGRDAAQLVHARYAARNGSSSGGPLEKLLAPGRPGGGGTESRRARAFTFLGLSHEATTTVAVNGTAASSWPIWTIAAAGLTFLQCCLVSQCEKKMKQGRGGEQSEVLLLAKEK